jgi:hypothetical protein
MGGGLLPAVPSTQQELWGVQQQQQQSLMEACMDGSPAAATAAAVAAAEEAAFVEEQEAAAAAEADAVAAAAQAAAAEQTPDTGAAGAQWCVVAVEATFNRFPLLMLSHHYCVFRTCRFAHGAVSLCKGHQPSAAPSLQLFHFCR